MNRIFLFAKSALCLVGLAILFPACAPRRGASAGPHSATTPEVAREAPGNVVDPLPGVSPCTGYTVDGISLGMPLSEVLKMPGIAPASTLEAALPDFEDSTYILDARRPGRRDSVRIGLTGRGEESKVAALRATIVVTNRDPWPASLFALLGSPREAKLNEWYWWDGSCRAAMSLAKIDALGRESESQPYIVEIRPFP